MNRLLLSALSLTLSIPVLALELDQAEQWALVSDPVLQRLGAEAGALEAEAIAAGQLPDPQLTLGVMNLPAPDLSLRREPMAQAQVGVSQRFPARARREAMSGVKRAQAETVRARQIARSLEVRRELRRLWALILHQEAMLELELERARILDELTETLDARLQVDLALQTAVLSSRARRARLEKALSERRASLARARANLGEWLDPRPLPEKLEAAEFHAPGEVRIEDHPAIAVARQGLDEAEQRIALADAGFRPGWALNVGVGQRFGNTPMGAPSDTLINAMVAIDLPLFTRNRQARDLEAARGRFTAAETGPLEVRRKLAAEYRSARDTHAEYSTIIAAYRDSVLPLSRDQEESAELDYRAGRGRLESVLEASLARLEAELEIEQLKLARDQSAIELLYLGGF